MLRVSRRRRCGSIRVAGDKILPERASPASLRREPRFGLRWAVTEEEGEEDEDEEEAGGSDHDDDDDAGGGGDCRACGMGRGGE